MIFLVSIHKLSLFPVISVFILYGMISKHRNRLLMLNKQYVAIYDNISIPKKGTASAKRLKL